MTLCYELFGIPKTMPELLHKVKKDGVKRADIIIRNDFLSTAAFDGGLYGSPQPEISSYSVSVHAAGASLGIYENLSSIFDAEGMRKDRVNAVRTAVKAAQMLTKKGLQAIIEGIPLSERKFLPKEEQEMLQSYS